LNGELIGSLGQEDKSLDLLKGLGSQTNPHMGVSKNRGTPKWMLSDGKPYEN